MSDADYVQNYNDQQDMLDTVIDYETGQAAKAASLKGTSVTWGQIGAGLGYASTAIDAFGKFSGYNDKADSLEEQARLTDLQAEKVLELAENTIGMIDQKVKKVTSTQKTTLTGRGISATGNTALAANNESIDQGRQEMANVDKQSKYDNYMLRMKAISERQAADAARSAGTFALISGALTIGASVLGGPMAGMAVGSLTNSMNKA